MVAAVRNLPASTHAGVDAGGLRLALLFCFFLAPLAAQETRGMIFGRVLDPQSSPVPGALIAVTNTETNVARRLTTNATGYYEANLLTSGNYQVAVEAPGFKRTVRSGITLAVSTRLEIDVTLELGAVAETVSVTAEAPLLDTSTVSSGRVIDNRNLMDLPVLGNSPTLLIKLTPGIQANGVNNYLGLHSNSGGSEYYTPGRVGGNEWTIDGALNSGDGRRIAYLPYSDTIQEFKVETSNFDASIGHSTGASIAMITKSGTNQFHGTLTEQHWQQRWNGTQFFTKQFYYQQINDAEGRGDKAEADRLRAQDKQPSGRSNNYAATIGGPVILPKLYNGKDRLFFFFNFNGFKDVKTETSGNVNRTIASLADREGDFSPLLAVHPTRYLIHDPLSVQADPSRPGHFIREVFPNNRVPRARMTNPAYSAYLKPLPIPNNPPRDPRDEPRNNYLAVRTPYDWDYKAFHNRVDYQASDRHRFFGRWSWNDFLEDRGDWTYESARGLHTNGLNRHNIGATVDWVYTMTSSTVLDAAVSGNEFRSGNIVPVLLRFKPSDVGLPKYLDEKAGDQHMLPFLNFDTYRDIGRDGYPTHTRYRVLTAKADLSHVRGRHSFRGGFDARQQFRTGGGGGNVGGTFRLTNTYTRRYDDSFLPAGDFGHVWAAFMMGFPSGMSAATNDSFAIHTPSYGWFAQDNWRLTPKLTLNLGFRVEYEQGPTERFNRVIGNFDLTAKLPISDAAQAAYARSPVPELAASGFIVRGGTNFPGVNGRGRRIYQSELMWMPRLGAAYQLNPRTVLRAGYGLYYDSLNSLNEGLSRTGFDRSTSAVITTDFGVNWLVGNPRDGIPPMADPFPVRTDGTRFDAPPRSSLGLMTVAGRNFDFNDYNSLRARQRRWRVGVQRQLTPNMVVEAAYSGAYSDRVYINDRPINPLPEQFFVGGLVRNNAHASNLDANVRNPFQLANFAELARTNPLVYQDMATQGFFQGSTVRKNRLLRPFPHMNTDLRQDLTPAGEARSDGLEVSLQRRFSKGFSLNFGYTRLRAREADFFFNDFDPLPSWRQSNDGRPHRLVATTMYELPFGKGRALASNGLSALLFGGFQVAVTYEWQPGPLIGFGNLFYYGEIADIAEGERTLDRWFNTAGFERDSNRGPAGFHRRVFPTRIDGVRRDMTNQWNANIQREFKFAERAALQLRLDALNLQNRSQFADPDASPFSTNFGKVTAQTEATNRFIQIQARIRF